MVSGVFSPEDAKRAIAIAISDIQRWIGGMQQPQSVDDVVAVFVGILGGSTRSVDCQNASGRAVCR
jgi:hypothetical protein